MSKEVCFAPPLLEWYHSHRRVLPFREHPLPYHVWVSEIMLQQTRMTAVLPYYQRFIAALPDVAALAACGEDELHKLWEGLGYYSRVRNLQKAARMVMEEYGGEIPPSYDELVKLPGVGAYTAGAIASIAFGQAVVAVDGNVLRVFARLVACTGDVGLPATKQKLGDVVRRQQPENAPGDFNQAVMELGALVCLPKAPRCGECPLAALCKARRLGTEQTLPAKAAKKPKKVLPVAVLVVRSGDTVLLHRRAEKGLLAGMWEPLTFEGALGEEELQEKLDALLPGAVLEKHAGAAQHIFTHRVWQMQAYLCTVPAGAEAPKGDYVFATRRQLEEQYALPGAFKAFWPLLAEETNGSFPV